MSSKFSVKNFAQSQDILQNAADSLSDFIKISIIWGLGVTLLLYSKYGWWGALTSIVFNLLVVLWITISYMNAFRDAYKKIPGGHMPTLRLITPSESS